VRRRDFLGVLGGAVVALPVVARGQQSAMPVIGYLGSESPKLFETRLRAFRQGLSSTGFDEGRNVKIDYEWAEGRNERLPSLVADLVRRNVNVIATPGSIAAALAAKAATETIPIVFETGADPVVTGLVASLNRPGGNLTGVSSLNAEVGPKRLELLHELLPAATDFALLVNSTNPKNAEVTTRDLQVAAVALKLKLHVMNASKESDFETVFGELAKMHFGGLVVANETFFANRSEQLAALAVRHAVPAIHQSRAFAVAGGLMGYGGSIKESHSQAGVYVGRILKGEKPTELPIQQVTKVEFVLNLRAAKVLGLNPSLSFIARADEVIE
jgi:putative tryptophan/tyrosine transport system substrate-binding protein